MKKAFENPLKKKLAARFLNALNNLTNNISVAEKSRRHHAIRAAAYASMASVVGPRKAWSRALLKSIRNHKPLMIHGKKKVVVRGRNPRNGDGLSDLSEVVPGGETMDSCRLLDEAGHYIKCLTAQVQIMRQILDSSSSTLIL